MSHHQGVVVQVPGLGDEGVGFRVHNGVLQDVDGPRHVGGKDVLRPPWQPVGFGQQSPWQQEVGGGDLTVQDVLSEDMSAGSQKQRSNQLLTA